MSNAQGGNIQKATDFTMLQTLNTTDGDGPVWELYPSIAAVAANYGDPDGKYAAFLANADNTYPSEPYFLFNQNFSDSGLASAKPTTGGPSVPPSTSSGASTRYPEVLGRFGGCFKFVASGLTVVLSLLV